MGLGLWLLFDKNSLISLMKSVDNEHVEVSFDLIRREVSQVVGGKKPEF